MTDTQAIDDARPKKDRSPSFPFISLRRAVERAEQFQIAHKRDPARLGTIALTWNYGLKSSGLLQTAAALKQYGLAEDIGGGEERKIRLTDLARKIIGDTRPGVKEQGLIEAAHNPKLFAEYIDRWVPDAPADSHCVSELVHDRGFTTEAAKAFLKSFKLTVSYAGLMARDKVSDQSAQLEQEEDAVEPALASDHGPLQGGHNNIGLALAGNISPTQLAINHGPEAPLAQRLKVEMTVNALSVTAVLANGVEVAKLVAMLQAMTPLLPPGEAEHPN